MSGSRKAQACRGLRLLVADSAAARCRGWLGRRRPPGRRVGLLLAPCRAVHTLGMTFPIDLVFLSRLGRVVKVVRCLRPWRVALCLRAVAVVELRAGVIDAEYGGVAGIEAAIKNAQRRN